MAIVKYIPTADCSTETDLVAAMLKVVTERDQARAALAEIKDYVQISDEMFRSDKLFLAEIIKKGLG